MKKWYREYLYIAKEGKISEKTLLGRITFMIVGMLFCVFSMGFTAYAYFSCSIASGVSTLQSATYDVNVYVKDIDVDTEILIDNNSCDLKVGSYVITIKASGTASTGYSKVKIGENEYFTRQMSPLETISFKIKCNETTRIGVVANWGTYSGVSNLEQNSSMTIGTEVASISAEQVTDVDKNQESIPNNEEQEVSDSETQEASDGQEQEVSDSQAQSASKGENSELSGTDEKADDIESTEQDLEQEKEGFIPQNE